MMSFNRSSFKRSTILSVALILGLVSGFVFFTHTTPTQAQDGMGSVTCDSTLVTLLYLGENDYGFHSMLDVTQIDKGQYGPLFEAMMARMDAESGMLAATPEDSVPGDTMMAETPESGMPAAMTMLTPGIVPGEDPLCTDLRAELDAFFYDTFTHDAMLMDGSGQ